MRVPVQNRSRRGSVLVEFALIALVLYLILAATIELGRMIFAAQVVNDTARVAARELSRIPLPPGLSFDQALNATEVRERVFDPSLLAIDLGTLPDDTNLDAYFAGLPIVNQMLRPLMIVDEVTFSDSQTFRLLRYPGAVYRFGTEFRVAIPRVLGRGSSGVEQIEWVEVVEEIRTNPQDPLTGKFARVSGDPNSGVVALRINYPFQAASMSGFQGTANSSSVNDSNIDRAIVADDSLVQVVGAGLPGELAAGDYQDGRPETYGGPYGLGRQLALGVGIGDEDGVRPFRRFLTGQSFYRRELYRAP